MILFFDTETTGMVNPRLPEDHRDQPRLVQLAALLVSLEGETVGQMEATVQPVGYTIPERAVAVHGITTECAAACGVDVRSVLSLFGQFCRLAKLLVAHNVAFDAAVMRGEYKRAGLADRLGELGRYCTMREAAPIVRARDTRGRVKWPTLAETYRFFYGAELERGHNAMMDVIACRRCFEQIEARRGREERQLSLLSAEVVRTTRRYPELDAIME